MMKKPVVLSIAVALATLLVSPLYAGNKKGDHSCCATTASNSQTLCVDYASLNLTPPQKSKLETWQAECTKAGCTKESRRTFLKQAKGILSADQYTKLKQQCESTKRAKA